MSFFARQFPVNHVLSAQLRSSSEGFIDVGRQEVPRRAEFPDSGPALDMIGFAHELLNELSVVSSAVHIMECQLGRHEGLEDETISESLKHIKSGIKRLGSLTHEFQDLGRPQGLNLKSTELASVIRDLLAIEGRGYAARGIRVRTAFPPSLPPIMLDAPKFRQVLLNLCHNAVEAMPHGGTLTLRAYRTNSHVHIAVIDNGTGIPRGMDAFAPFTTTKPTGTGIGLMIVRQIVYRHGGTINYTSQPERGTIFHIALPLFSA